MPPPSTSDWPAVKATAIARNSIKEAADLHSVPYTAAKMRASREKWPVGQRTAQAVEKAKQANREQLAKVSPASVTAVTSTSDALVTALAEDSQATRIGFSKAGRKAAEHLATLAPQVLVDKDTAQSAKHWHGVASGTHAWDEKPESNNFMVSIALIKLDLPPARPEPAIKSATILNQS